MFWCKFNLRTVKGYPLHITAILVLFTYLENDALALKSYSLYVTVNVKYYRGCTYMSLSECYFCTFFTFLGQPVIPRNLVKLNSQHNLTLINNSNKLKHLLGKSIGPL